MITDPLKIKIKTSFNRASNTYDNYAALQKKICLELISLLQTQHKNYQVIADSACGTGISTKELLHTFNPEKLYAIDFSEQLLEQATNKLKQSSVHFLLADFDETPVPHHSIDLLFSSMGLQWSPNLYHTLSHFHDLITQKGILAFAIPIEGTFSELNPACKNVLHTKSALEKILTHSQFNIINITIIPYIEKFANQADAIKSIRMIGANCKTHQTNTKATSPFIDPDTSALTYQICFVIAEAR